MTTKVFISWSGNLSKQLAEEIKNWLPGVLQHVEPYFTPDDVEKGAKWYSDITTELGDSNIGLICLTANNLEKPWILFEAGALSKKFDSSNVCTILFDVEPTEITGPLSNFQATRFNKEDFRKLLSTINGNSDPGDKKLQQSVLERVFNTMWPILEERIGSILSNQSAHSEKPKRPDRDILEEILERIRTEKSNPIVNSNLISSVKDLIISIGEIHQIAYRENNFKLLAIMSDLEKPLRDICHKTDQSSVLKKYLTIFKNNRQQFRETSKKTEDLKISKDDMRRLIKKGEETGCLSFEEINDAISNDLRSFDQIDDIVIHFKALGIDVNGH